MPNSENGQLPEFIGKRVDPTYSKILQQKLKELLHTTSDSINSFPGSQPVCFESKHLIDIEREDYYVCERSDGVRYLLLFVQSPKGPASFLYDRNRYWYYVPNLLFPTRGRENEYLKDTLMDGELVLDVDDKKKTWRYLIFDLMVVNGLSIVQRSFNTRLGMLQQDVIQPLNMGLRNLAETDRPPFSVELKKMERSYGLHLVFDQIPKLKHKTDGIIWTPVKYPYTSGTCQKLLKWKPPESNTVDFRIAARWSKEHKPIYSIEVLSHGVTYKFYDHFQPEPALATKWKSHLPDGRIAEFRYDPDCEVTIVEQGYAPTVRKGGWRFVRFRDDKGIANDENVVKKILNSIKDGVTKEQLLSCMDRVRAAWKAREKGLPMPPLPSKHALKSPSSDQSKTDSNFTSTLPAAATCSKITSDARPSSRQFSSFDDSDIPARFTKRKTSETSFSVKTETSEGIDGNLPERKKLKGTITSKGEQLKEFTGITENDSIANDTQVTKQVGDDHSAQFERIISDSKTEYLKNELSPDNIDSALQEKQADAKATVTMERTLKEVISVKHSPLQSPNNESSTQGKHSLPTDIQKKVENIPDATVQTSSLLEHVTERRPSHTGGLDGSLSTKQQLKSVSGTCSFTYPSLVSKEQEMIRSSDCLKGQGVASKRANNPLFEAYPATSEDKFVTEGDQTSIKV
ncbi:Dcp1p-Dcp2p decapping enzyme complex alpha subunit [Rhizopus azygosporus]|uniref:mRNA guanylyltransferase n=1 Tax=Rhizopus azygosporus TaxID=86630 RepID=A0A367JNZ3_RHIAZ|nr:Dcp1p-Dcp2p decapping enzyme complex alpha subunit [Rhizopus azygosporus]